MHSYAPPVAGGGIAWSIYLEVALVVGSYILTDYMIVVSVLKCGE